MFSFSPNHKLKNKKQEIARQKCELLFSEISFFRYWVTWWFKKNKYYFDGMLPFKYLTWKPEFDNGVEAKLKIIKIFKYIKIRLKLWVPDSIIINERNGFPRCGWFLK